MGNYLKNKDYFGSIEFSADDNVLFGKVVGVSDLVYYQADYMDNGTSKNSLFFS